MPAEVARFDGASVRCSDAAPCRKIGDSRSLHWQSLFLSAYESPRTSDPVEVSGTPDQALRVITRGTVRLSLFSSGKWRSATRTVGSVRLTPGGRPQRLRWTAESETFESAQIFIPQTAFSIAADELRRAGQKPRVAQLECVSLMDPVVSHLSLALAWAYRDGSAETLAGPIAQALTVRLLSINGPGAEIDDGQRSASRLHGIRLSELLEFMRAHCSQPLTLDRLASEAGFSRFHFARSFKNAVGVSPHRYLIDARLEAVSAMLEQTDCTLLDIAHRCGFSSAGHLSSAFRERFAQTPSEYRRNPDRSRPRDARLHRGQNLWPVDGAWKSRNALPEHASVPDD